MVSGTEARLDVAVGADHLATLLAKELLPLDRDGGDFAARAASPRPGSVGVVASPAVDEEATRKHNRGSRALVRLARWCSRRCSAGRSVGGRYFWRDGSSGASRGTTLGRFNPPRVSLCSPI